MARNFLPEPINPHWFRQVLEMSFAQVVEGEGRVAPDVVEEASAYTDSVRLRLLLNASGDVHPVADEVINHDQDVS
jgi:hypothetical protein